MSDTEIKGEYPFSELAKRQKRQQRGPGRPIKGVRRYPTTVHLTEAERTQLGQTQVEIRRYFPVSRSELVGVAISVLGEMIESAIASGKLVTTDLDALRAWALEQVYFLELKNQKM
jgi:hypothetical protein